MFFVFVIFVYLLIKNDIKSSKQTDHWKYENTNFSVSSIIKKFRKLNILYRQCLNYTSKLFGKSNFQDYIVFLKPIIISKHDSIPVFL